MRIFVFFCLSFLDHSSAVVHYPCVCAGSFVAGSCPNSPKGKK